MRYIWKITHAISTVNKKIEINTCGKNLIIMGGNGSGKTTFVRDVHQKLRQLMIEDLAGSLLKLRKNLASDERYLAGIKDRPDQESEVDQVTRRIKQYEAEIAQLSHGPGVEIQNQEEFRKYALSGRGLVEFFDASRQAEINAATGAETTVYDLKELISGSVQGIGAKFEKHLTNLKTRRSFAITETPDKKLAVEIEHWFAKLDTDLRFLFEDESTQLSFDPRKFKFFITQDGRPPFTFQTLSSGYSAIFHILSRLLMRAEYLETLPSELSGVAIIDEIDAHLHVSLQRKIFPFITKMFPNVQFIVTTHSPFVLASVEDAVIFDISTQESASDISSYSYDAILQAVFNVPTISDVLRNKVMRLCTLLDKNQLDLPELASIVASIGGGASTLDEESAFYIGKAKLELLKAKAKTQEGRDV